MPSVQIRCILTGRRSNCCRDSMKNRLGSVSGAAVRKQLRNVVSHYAGRLSLNREYLNVAEPLSLSLSCSLVGCEKQGITTHKS